MPTASKAKPTDSRYVSLSPTSNFKGVSRASTANWGNRFIRDHNDLVYDADVNSISRRMQPKTRPQTKKHQQVNPGEEAQTKPYQYSPEKQRSSCWMMQDR